MMVLKLKRWLSGRSVRKVTSLLLILGIAINVYLWDAGNQLVIPKPRGLAGNRDFIEANGKLGFTSDDDRIEKESANNVDGRDVCDASLIGNISIPNQELRTDMTDWSFKKTVRCPYFSTAKPKQRRLKTSLDCGGHTPKLMTSWTEAAADVFRIRFGDPCLVSVIDRCCKGDNPVPNVVHYIWYSKRELGYFQFLSFMSVLRFMQPCLILLHGDYVPYGDYWDYFLSLAPNVIHVKRERPTSIFGQKLKFKEHASDIMRIEGLTTYGGVYLDFDEILLRPIEPLRRYPFTMGHELAKTMGSQLVMAEKNATFLRQWYQSYRDDYRKSWAWNALWVPNKIASSSPNLIHVEGYNFTRPSWQNVRQIFKENYDWSTNYGMHMYVRWYKNATSPEIIRTLNTTIGAVSRHVLLGNKELCDK